MNLLNTAPTGMKKRLLTAFVCLCSVFSSIAQYSKFGFTVGTIFANYNTKNDMVQSRGKDKTGIAAGMLAEFPMGGNISFQTNLNFVQKGTKDLENFQGFEKSSTRVNYLEWPMNFLFNVYSKQGTFSIGGGPSFSFALSGKYDTGSESGDLKFGNDPGKDHMRRFEFGANMLAGYRFRNGLFLTAGYNTGLNNLTPGGQVGNTLRSNYFSIKLGYSLEKKLCKKKMTPYYQEIHR